MTPARWNRILDVFSTAVEHAPGPRAAFLDAACAGDAALRREVEELLAAHDADPEYLEEAAARVPPPPGAPRASTTETMEGRHVGPYRVLRRLGEGGMGAVYLAVRDDDQYRKHVALKLVKRGMDTDRVLRRFRHERQILASLDHPNVARLLDGGAADDGRPYFAMEHVEGQPLDAYCDARALPIPARLALFRTVCMAVHAAHQNLVVHRDLKPSNILVTDDGRVKLLDFGIAKLLNPDLSPATIPVTQTELRLMTPEYASPEQVRGEPITTASDVYQLGVLLYELLTGHRPYRLANRTAADVARVICEEDPERPSTAVRRTAEVPAEGGTRAITPEAVSAARATEPERLRRRLSGDLDTIVLKAMQKEPARRYASAEALAEDLQRYLDGLPVAARPDTAGYRLRKFVRRHRWGAGGAALVAASLLLGIGGTAWQARVATTERDRAQQEAAKAAQVTDFLLGLFESADPVTAPRDTIRVRDVLEAGAARTDALADQPAVQAELYSVLSNAYRHLGRPARAATLEAQALALRRELHDGAHLATATSLYNLGLLLEEQHQPAEAAALYREAAAMLRALYGDTHPQHLNTLYRLALTLHMSGQRSEADSLFATWQLGHQRPLGDDDPRLAATLGEMGAFLQYTGRLDDAETLLREAVAMHEAIYSEGHYERAASHGALGEALLLQNRFEEAEPLLQEALAQYQALYGQDHPVVGQGYVLHAQLYHQWGRYDDAEAFYRDAVALYERLFGADYPVTIERRVLLGDLLTDRGHYPAAERVLLDAYERLHAGRGPEDRYTQGALRRVVRLYETWNRPDDAATYRARLTAPPPS